MNIYATWEKSIGALGTLSEAWVAEDAAYLKRQRKGSLNHERTDGRRATAKVRGSASIAIRSEIPLLFSRCARSVSRLLEVARRAVHLVNGRQRTECGRRGTVTLAMTA